MLNSLSLRLKFISGLVLFALVLGICISVILNFHFNSIMKAEISQRSRMLLAQSSAVQDYVRNVLRPEMFDILPDGRFLLSAMSSSYISREVMGRLNTIDNITYHYRRVSKNPRNPESAPNDFESSLITLFSKNRHLSIWEDDAMVKKEAYHIVARPVEFQAACLHCHGEPADAPTELLEKYGSENGFHYTAGEIGGVVIAGFPIEQIESPAKEVTLQYLMYYMIGIFMFAALISLFFDRLVMKNLQALTTIFRSRFSGDREIGIIERLKEKDEIEGLIEGVDELALCLSDARNDLEDHAKNLEEKVAERTREIERKSKIHEADVHLFVEMLFRFVGFSTTDEVITSALENIGIRFHARQVTYHCTVISDNSYAWHADAPRGSIDNAVKEILWSDAVLQKGQTLYIPVKTIESHWGILSITLPSDEDLKQIDFSILRALGHQLAVMIENIQAFSNVRFQNDMLQSVFEGITDPLLLIDTHCRVLMANTGGRRLFSDSNEGGWSDELNGFLNAEPILISKAIAAGTPVSREITTGRGASFKLFLYPLPKREKGDVKLVLYAREITLEKQMASRMQQAERLSAIGKMAAGVAHEINNPLGVISCYTDLVKDAVNDSEILEDLGIIEKHTLGVQKIVQDLLKLARPKGAISGICSINPVVAGALKVFQAQGASKGIQVDAVLASSLPKIKCDAGILEQILTNLWLNAYDVLLERKDEGGRVKIETAWVLHGADHDHLGASEGKGGNEKKEKVRLTMTDNGPGISDQILEHIFDPFFTTKAVGKGTGLGLSVVYGFINEMGGHIEVKSAELTQFDIYFPAEEESDTQ